MSLVQEQNTDQFLWAEKYRPATVADCILPKDLKNTALGYIRKRNLPNMIFASGSGMGKTTLAKAMANEVDAEFYVVNGSLNANMEKLRNDIEQFCATASFNGKRKLLIIDEADYLGAHNFQPALRGFIDQYSAGCAFILTCNYPQRLIKPLRESRTPIIEFTIPAEEKPELAAEFFTRAMQILENEGIKYDKSALAQIITRYFPDFRRVLTELQNRATSFGEINEESARDRRDADIAGLVKAIRGKDFNALRIWVETSGLVDIDTVWRRIYDAMEPIAKPQFLPLIIVNLADYQHKSAFVADQGINLMACVSIITADIEFK